MKSKNTIEYTKKEFFPVFDTIKKCIKEDRFQIELNENRQENIDFINEFNLRQKRIKEILSDIKIDDFCYATRDIKNRDVILYVFSPNATVYNCDDVILKIQMYIKFRIIHTTVPETLITISFHKLNERISFAFK